MKLRKYFIRKIIAVSGVPYEEGMPQHILEATLKIECSGALEEQIWSFGKDDWLNIKKDGYFLA